MTTQTVYDFSPEWQLPSGLMVQDVHGAPAYAIKARGRIIHESLYRNSGHPVAIVAVGPSGDGTWAAYIGPALDPKEPEEQTMAYVAASGSKLEVDEAIRIVRPDLVEHLGGAATYRP